MPSLQPTSLLYSYISIILLSFFSRCIAQQAVSITASLSSVDSTACGELLNGTDQDITLSVMPASQAYDCLLSVPLNIDVALRFIDYYNTTLQFHSTLAFLKDPPNEYQQPSIDVLQGLQDIRQNLTTGFYQNQYEFEATLQSLVHRIHDAHLTLDAGILSVFKFGSQYDIVSLSIDGKEPPQVYLTDHVLSALREGGQPSPIVSINGEDVVSFLTRFASVNSLGTLEPHADWNQLMSTPVQEILGLDNTFGWEIPLYPGTLRDDSLNFTLANTTKVASYWVAIYQNLYKTGPLTTGGDFYNYFVLGLSPASFNVSVRDGFDSSMSDAPASTSWANVSKAYPNYTDIVQKDLSLAGGGFLTGYFFNATSTAVLSIPSFQEYGDAISTFGNTIDEFVQKAKSAGMRRVVVDLQQNLGGDPLLAFDTFKNFFPNFNLFAGSQRRIQPMANVLGEAMTSYWTSLTPESDPKTYQDLHDTLAANEWIVTDRINAATGHYFGSWREYSGPLMFHNDSFSLVERYNLSDAVFDSSALQVDDQPLPDLTSNREATTPPWDPENIVLLTDGACSSACAIFVELMSHQAGVRSVVVGGIPKPGPMQAVAGSRGAVAYSADGLDMDFQIAGYFNETAQAMLRQDPDTGMMVNFAGFTLRHQIRDNDTVPLQFKYEPADCRIYYTLANIWNETRLWMDAMTAMWDDPSLCVKGSTGYGHSTSNNQTSQPPPYPSTWSNTSIPFHGIQSSSSPNIMDYVILRPLQDGEKVPRSGDFQSCTSSCRDCKNSTCIDGQPVNLCAMDCSNIGGECGFGRGVCRASNQIDLKVNLQQGQQQQFHVAPSRSRNLGSCEPVAGSLFSECPR